MKLPIPCSVVTGTLGVGKTTFITSLLTKKPPGEKWAVLVNEFGALGVDGSLLSDGPASSSSGQGIVIRELAGGCLCCQASGMLGVAIAQLLRTAKPDRLIIEPSGLGHPAGLLKILQSEHLAPALRIQAVICLVDVRTARDLYYDSPASADQVDVSDVLIGHKTDLATEEQVQAFLSWAATLEPHKAQVLTCSHGTIVNGLELLQAPHSDAYASLLASPSNRTRPRQRHGSTPEASARSIDLLAGPNLVGTSPSGSEPDGQDPQLSSQGPTPGQPTRQVTTASKEHVACGWRFHASDVFKQEQLLAFLQQLLPCVIRLKGVFRVGDTEWMSVNWVATGGAPLSWVATRQHEDSRVELIIESSSKTGTPASSEDADAVSSRMASKDWAAVERLLIKTLMMMHAAEGNKTVS